MYDLRPLVKGPLAPSREWPLFGVPLLNILVSCICGSLRLCWSSGCCCVLPATIPFLGQQPGCGSGPSPPSGPEDGKGSASPWSPYTISHPWRTQPRRCPCPCSGRPFFTSFFFFTGNEPFRNECQLVYIKIVNCLRKTCGGSMKQP